MYVIRGKAKAKRGHAQALINHFRNAKIENGKITRIYANIFGDNDIVAVELEFDDIESAARHMEWIESEETQKEVTGTGWYDMTQGNAVELWKVID